MKKNLLLSIFILLFAVILLPVTTNAKEVTVYVFRGETCTYCKKALNFLGTLSLDDNYKDKFKVQTYEVWNDSKNSELMEKAADAMGETVNGVPYIIIGNETWNGYAESYNEDMKKAILDTYNDDNFVSKVSEILPVGDIDESKSSKDIVGIVAIGFIVIVLLVATISFARKSDTSIKKLTKEEAKEEVHEVKETLVKPKKETSKDNAKKKSNKTTKKSKSNSKKKTK